MAIGLRSKRIAALTLVLTGTCWARAQAGPSDLPDSPGTPAPETKAVQTAAAQKASEDAAADSDGKQTKRILGIIPNFRSVSADMTLPPLSTKEKFSEATQDSFDYSAIFLPAAVAGLSDARRSTPEFGHGGIAYGRYLWHTALDQTIENYAVEFIGPALTHQDPRYYTLGHGGFLKRTGYSLSRVLVTRNDNAREVFNSSEVFGALGSAGISNLYYPSAERSISSTMTGFATSIVIDAGTFMVHEFWPDINNSWFHIKD